MPNLLPIFGECILSIFVLDKLNKRLTRLPPCLVHLHCYTSSRNSHPYKYMCVREGVGGEGMGEGGGGTNKQTNKQERDVGRSRNGEIGRGREEEKCESIKAI